MKSNIKNDLLSISLPYDELDLGRSYLELVKLNLKSMISYARRIGQDPQEAFNYKMLYFEDESKKILLQREMFEYLLETESSWSGPARSRP